MTSDRPSRFVSLTSKLAEFLAQPTYECRFVSPQPKRLGFREVSRSTQLAK